MRVFLAAQGCGPFPSHNAPWRIHLHDSLCEMGHEVVCSTVNWDEPVVNNWEGWDRGKISEQLVQEVKRAHATGGVDLFFSYFYSGHVETAAIGAIRKAGIPAVNFFCDAVHSFELVSGIAPTYDLCWVPEIAALPLYRAAGATPIHLPMAANPKRFYPLPNVQRDIRLLFSGRLYADRPMLVAGLRNRGLEVTVHTFDLVPDPLLRVAGAEANGNSAWNALYSHWRRYGAISTGRATYRKFQKRFYLPRVLAEAKPPVPEKELIPLIARSEGVLNFCTHYAHNEPGGRKTAYAKLRDFEIPMCRALYVPQYVQELEHYYVPDKEMVAWRTVDEAADKFGRLQRHPAEVEKIREAGYRRALNEHQWSHRFSKLFQALSLERSSAFRGGGV